MFQLLLLKINFWSSLYSGCKSCYKFCQCPFQSVICSLFNRILDLDEFNFISLFFSFLYGVLTFVFPGFVVIYVLFEITFLIKLISIFTYIFFYFRGSFLFTYSSLIYLDFSSEWF